MEQTNFHSEFQTKLADLMKEISTLPKTERTKLADLAGKTQQKHTELKKTVDGLQESLDYLRLSIKYLVFDLEATRRENSYLRKVIEEEDQTPEPGNDLGSDDFSSGDLNF
ncbi:hypothetical protein KS4_06940 [Poriferisphaera corsica]|uniref:Uncharacterized protein n=1 Tax=Poriferisphaera corsica TaxID=2528020 RepID=A0A517YR09_9BACT|nr:hypothetical protein [Poriferisphaera corsica]QDU32660.1 hypothetical protein KS4_06940 [Poriferisphaera corsica]